MAVVDNGVIRVDGVVVGTVREYEENTRKYVIK